SGKTLVAFAACLMAAAKGLQAAFLAPTEILAQQHYQTAQKYFPAGLQIKLSLLTGAQASLDGQSLPKAKLQALIREGMPGLFFGTHALLQKNVKFKNLGLVVIDEQHRFGVDQRAGLLNSPGRPPHLLSLSATPIPRTLQLAFYGELDVSQIKTKPAGRRPIQTRLVPESGRDQAYGFIAKELAAGRQAFVITPLVEESDRLGLKSAKAEYLSLQKIFPQFKLTLLHGKMKTKDKEAAMAEFLSGKTQILVATSVVEVGVDVPNASVMAIEGAERFGLAQLHQFRGRVGRGAHQSYCLLLTKEADEETQARLQGFAQTQDGFVLAELDLKQRGFGELYGQQQAGWNFKYFDPSYTSLIAPARAEALALLQADLELKKYPLLWEKIAGKTIHFE
ncbi:MAG TPA: DEAD/DEAH box helicase, partial [Patescibacteria group bacterium]|nr:DEAD/DEAH box helicase [Patescibacteria group bacterium]